MRDYDKTKEQLLNELEKSRRRIDELEALEALVTELLAERSQGRGSGPGVGKTILVVDDEEAFRDSIGRILSRFGYMVLSAASGEAALDLLKEKRSRVDCVLLDIVMKGMGGTETFQKMRDIVPTLPIIICTGNAVAARDALSGSTQQLLSRAGITFMQKPLRPDQLVVELKKIIN